MDYASISSNLLYVAFIAYLVATFFFGGAIRDKRAAQNKTNWATF